MEALLEKKRKRKKPRKRQRKKRKLLDLASALEQLLMNPLQLRQRRRASLRLKLKQRCLRQSHPLDRCAG
eukprot:symbB.v1.2.016676.t1/scaffold1275.1/size127301/4